MDPLAMLDRALRRSQTPLLCGTFCWHGLGLHVPLERGHCKLVLYGNIPILMGVAFSI